MEFWWEKIEGNLRRANTEPSVHFRRANTELSMDCRKANTELSMHFRRVNTEQYIIIKDGILKFNFFNITS